MRGLRGLRGLMNPAGAFRAGNANPGREERRRTGRVAALRACQRGNMGARPTSAGAFPAREMKASLRGGSLGPFRRSVRAQGVLENRFRKRRRSRRRPGFRRRRFEIGKRAVENRPVHPRRQNGKNRRGDGSQLHPVGSGNLERLAARNVRPGGRIPPWLRGGVRSCRIAGGGAIRLAAAVFHLRGKVRVIEQARQGAMVGEHEPRREHQRGRRAPECLPGKTREKHKEGCQFPAPAGVGLDFAGCSVAHGAKG